MKYRIKKAGRKLNIAVTDIEGKSKELLKAFNDCKEGNCSCKSAEYRKVESFEVKTDDADVQLILTAKDREEIDAAEIDECLQRTRANLFDEE